GRVPVIEQKKAAYAEHHRPRPCRGEVIEFEGREQHVLPGAAIDRLRIVFLARAVFVRDDGLLIVVKRVVKVQLQAELLQHARGELVADTALGGDEHGAVDLEAPFFGERGTAVKSADLEARLDETARRMVAQRRAQTRYDEIAPADGGG